MAKPNAHKIYNGTSPGRRVDAPESNDNNDDKAAALSSSSSSSTESDPELLLDPPTVEEVLHRAQLCLALYQRALIEMRWQQSKDGSAKAACQNELETLQQQLPPKTEKPAKSKQAAENNENESEDEEEDEELELEQEERMLIDDVPLGSLEADVLDNVLMNRESLGVLLWALSLQPDIPSFDASSTTSTPTADYLRGLETRACTLLGKKPEELSLRSEEEISSELQRFGTWLDRVEAERDMRASDMKASGDLLKQMISDEDISTLKTEAEFDAAKHDFKIAGTSKCVCDLNNTELAVLIDCVEVRNTTLQFLLYGLVVGDGNDDMVVGAEEDFEFVDEEEEEGEEEDGEGDDQEDEDDEEEEEPAAQHPRSRTERNDDADEDMPGKKRRKV